MARRSRPVSLIRNVLDDIDGPRWAGRPALTVMLAAELWDPHLHAAVIEWPMKTGRESGSPLALRLGPAQVVSKAALTGGFGQAMAAIADATGAPPVNYPGCTWPLCVVAARRRSSCSRRLRQGATPGN